MKAKFKNGEYIAPVVPIGYKINPAEKNRLAVEKVPITAWWASQKNGYEANIFEGQPEGKKYLWNIVTVSKILQNKSILATPCITRYRNSPTSQRRTLSNRKRTGCGLRTPTRH